jgi:beta-phosphoglucomutase-like phosphatase (HAD superfamily)
VFEDTEIGIQAAKAAGMASVKVPPPRERRVSLRSDEPPQKLCLPR